MKLFASNFAMEIISLPILSTKNLLDQSKKQFNARKKHLQIYNLFSVRSIVFA